MANDRTRLEAPSRRLFCGAVRTVTLETTMSSSAGDVGIIFQSMPITGWPHDDCVVISGSMPGPWQSVAVGAAARESPKLLASARAALTVASPRSGAAAQHPRAFPRSASTVKSVPEDSDA